MKRKTRKNSTKKMGLSASDYRKILKFYKLSIPKKVSNLIKKGDKIIAKKFCSCIKKVRKKFKKEGIAIGICTKSVITRKGIKRGSFNCKSKTSIDLYKGGSKRSTKKKTRKRRGGAPPKDREAAAKRLIKFNETLRERTQKLIDDDIWKDKVKSGIPPRFISPITVPGIKVPGQGQEGGSKRSTKKKTRKKRGAGGVFSCKRCGNKKDKKEEADYWEDGKPMFFIPSDSEDDIPEWFQDTEPVLQPMKHYQTLSLVDGNDKRPISPPLPLDIQEAARISPLLSLDDKEEGFGQFVSIEDYKGGRRRRTRKRRGGGLFENDVIAALRDENIEGKKCLDIGTRDGLNCVTLVKYGAESVLGIDTDISQFEKHEEVKMEEKITLRKQDFFDDNFNEKFDVITCFLWNFGLPQLDEFGNKVKSLLKPGGVFYLGLVDKAYVSPNSGVSVDTRLKYILGSQVEISKPRSGQKIWRYKID